MTSTERWVYRWVVDGVVCPATLPTNSRENPALTIIGCGLMTDIMDSGIFNHCLFARSFPSPVDGLIWRSVSLSKYEGRNYGIGTSGKFESI